MCFMTNFYKIIIFPLFLLAISNLFSVDRTWKPGVTGLWETPSNWVGGVVPGITDKAIINSGTAQIRITTSPTSVNEIALNGGTLDTFGIDFTCNLLSSGVSGGTVTRTGSDPVHFLFVGPDGSSSIFNGNITSTMIQKQGSGTWTFGGNASSGALIYVAGGNVLLTKTNAFNGIYLNIDGGNVNFNNFNQKLSRFTGVGFNLNLGTAFLELSNFIINSGFSGTIAGSGGINVNIPGFEFALSGLIFSNSYTGDTTVTAGTLVLSKSNNKIAIPGKLLIQGGTVRLQNSNQIVDTSDVEITSGTLNLNNQSETIRYLYGTGGNVSLGSGTLTVTGSGIDQTFSGNFSGTGRLVKQGSNILTLNGTSSCSNGTVSAGTLKGTAQSLPSNIINNSFLIYDQNTPGTITGNISGTGTLIKQGSDTLTLSGSTSCSNGTVSSGILQGTTASLPTNITNNSELIYNQNSNGTISGNISGIGQFSKMGTGIVTYSGSGFFQNFIDLMEGTFDLQAPITSTTGLTIENPATLIGSGTINSNVNCFGTISPGNSPGVITINGDLNFNSTSTYIVEFDPLTSDLLNVNGTVTIQPGARIELLPLFGVSMYNPTTYVIINSTNNIGGTFSDVFSPFPAFKGFLSYDDPMKVQFLILQTVDFTEVLGSDGNAFTIADYFDHITPENGSDLDYVYENLQFLQRDEMRDAFDQIHPAIFKGLNISQEINSSKITSLQSKRAFSFYNSCDRCAQKDKNSLWIAPDGDFVYQGGFKDLKGFNLKSGSILIGYDRKVFNNTFLGLTGGYSNSHIDWNKKRGKATINSYYGGLYSFFYNNHFYMNSSLYGVYIDYSTKRNLNFNQIHRIAKGSHHGQEFIGHIDMGRFWESSIIKISPSLSLDYFFIHEKEYTEKGANSLNLNIKKKNYQMLRAEAGISFSKCYIFGKHSLLPQVGISYIKEIRMSGKYYTARLEDQKSYFTIYGINKDLDLISPSFSLNYSKNSESLIFSIGYSGEFGKHRQDNNLFFQFIYHF